MTKAGALSPKAKATPRPPTGQTDPQITYYGRDHKRDPDTPGTQDGKATHEMTGPPPSSNRATHSITHSRPPATLPSPTTTRAHPAPKNLKGILNSSCPLRYNLNCNDCIKHPTPPNFTATCPSPTLTTAQAHPAPYDLSYQLHFRRYLHHIPFSASPQSFPNSCRMFGMTLLLHWFRLPHFR